MLKYVVTDINNNTHILEIDDKKNNYQMQLEDEHTYQSKGYYIALNFDVLEPSSSVNDIYSFFKSIKQIEILDFEIYYITDNREYNVFRLSDYDGLKVNKVGYDKRMINADSNTNEEIKFVEKIIFFLQQ